MRWLKKLFKIGEEKNKPIPLNDGDITSLMKRNEQLKRCHFKHYDHIHDGRAIILETRFTNIDRLIVTAYSVCESITDFQHIQKEQQQASNGTPIPLDKFLVTARGYVVPIDLAAKRLSEIIDLYLQAIGEQMLLQEQYQEHFVNATKVLAYNLNEAAMALLEASDEQKGHH